MEYALVPAEILLVYIYGEGLRDETKMFSSKMLMLSKKTGDFLDAETDIGFNDIQKTREFQCRNPFFI